MGIVAVFGMMTMFTTALTLRGMRYEGESASLLFTCLASFSPSGVAEEQLSQSFANILEEGTDFGIMNSLLCRSHYGVHAYPHRCWSSSTVLGYQIDLHHHIRWSYMDRRSDSSRNQNALLQLRQPCDHLPTLTRWRSSGHEAHSMACRIWHSCLPLDSRSSRLRDASLHNSLNQST